MNSRELTCYQYLLEFEYFTDEELNLAVKGWGDNPKTYDTICHVRYAMTIDQMALEDKKLCGEKIVLTDYPNQIE